MSETEQYNRILRTYPGMKPVVLILCTGNSCRRHLAEGILCAAAGDALNVQSAGSKPAGYVHPLAKKLAVFGRVRDEIKRVFEAYAAGRRDQAPLTRQKGTGVLWRDVS